VVVFAFVVGVSFVSAVSVAGATDPDQVLLPDGDYLGDNFGRIVAPSNGTLVVGFRHEGPPAPAPFDNEFVHIYEKSGDEWVEVQQLVEPYPGFAAATFVVDGEWIAIIDEIEGSCDAVRLFRRVGGTWSEFQTLVPDECIEFGQKDGDPIALRADRLAVASRSSLNLYEFDGSTWQLRDSVLTGGETGAVALSNRWLGVVVLDDSPMNGGIGVLVYDLTTDMLTDSALLSLSNEEILPVCRELAVDDSRILVGCTENFQEAALGHGAVFVFEQSNGNWTETTALTPSNGFGDFVLFGNSVAMAGDRVLVGAPGWVNGLDQQVGAAYLFSLIDGEWAHTGFYPGEWVPGVLGRQGVSVAIDGDQLIVGDPWYARHGRVLIYDSPSGRFSDDEGSIFENAINWLASEGITRGCNPPLNTEFCTNDFVTRGEMAVFLVRAMGYTDNGGGNLFIDDDGLFYENAADRLFTAGVTQGCNPPVNNKYCGERNVTRGEMAAFLVRAMGYTDNGGGNLFVDDDGHLFENAIDKLGAAKVTLGCNPPVNDKFCPNDFVTRGQMAAFLKRALT